MTRAPARAARAADLEGADSPFVPVSWVFKLRGLAMLEAGMGEGDKGAGENSVTGSENAPAPSPEPLRAVIVEDEAVIAIDIEDMLAAMGAEVVGTALTADQAVRLAEAERPDFVTMDIRLQGARDGISAAIEIFERFGIRSVFISAYGDPQTVARAKRASPLGWVSKPLRQSKLEEALQDILPDPRKP